MLPEEKRYQGVYNGISSDEGVDLRATEKVNRDEEILNMRDAIENLQRRVFELERLNKTIADEAGSAMGRPFCKVVKGKILKQDLSDGVDINKYKFPKLDTYMIDYMHFFRNMHKWDAFDGFEVQLLSSNQPIVGERALLRLGNIDFAIVTIEDRLVGCDGVSCIVDNIRLIPSFFKLGKIFGAKTYPEFMDAIEVIR